MTMFIGLVLEFLTLIAPADLQKASGPEKAVNKFLITDGLLRKAGMRESPNPGHDSNSSLQSLDPSPSLQNAAKADVTTKWTTVNADVTKMELMQKDGLQVEQTSYPKNTTPGQAADVMVVSKEHLLGQFLVCNPIYEEECNGSQCVQVYEGSIKCVVDKCQGRMLISCRNGHDCYSREQHCDEVSNCVDGSDEMNCLTLVQVHDERHFYTRTVPFMAILCLMGVAASFVLYHQTNAARQRQRHLSMVGLTNALTTAGLAQRMDGHTAPRAWRTRDAPSPGLLGDVPGEADPLEAVGAQPLEQMGARLIQDFDHLGTSAQQLQLLAGSPDGFCDDPLDVSSYTTSFQEGYSGYSAEGTQTEGSAPPPYEAALQMGKLTDHGLTSAGVVMDTDPPPYESVSHITCTSVFPMTNV